MTAPGPAWSAEKEDLLRSLAAAGESAVAIATLLKRSDHAVGKRADLLEIKLARSLPGPKSKWNEGGETERAGGNGGKAIRDRAQASTGTGPPYRASGNRETSRADSRS
jgi:hypothetical protein